jgi:hypothetical protein
VAQQPQGRFRRFLASPIGWVFVLLVANLVVFGIFGALQEPILAIPAILLFGLAIPIWTGHKRARNLALGGLVIVLVVAPASNLVFTQLIMTPVGASASATGPFFSNGPAMMQNATVSPYLGSTDTNFTWNVTVYPANHPPNNSTPVELDLFISTCPGATGNSSPNCSSGYPLTVLQNKTLPNTTSPYLVTFHYRIGSDGVWTWQMGLYTQNNTTKRPYFQLLVGDPLYNGIEGPVIGGFYVIYGDLLPYVYTQDLLYLALPFYIILMVYMLFKARERRRREAAQRAAGPLPPEKGEGPPAAGAPGAPLPSTPKGPSGGTASAVAELNCPKCNAVVYAGETNCWKCGEPLPHGSPSSS